MPSALQTYSSFSLRPQMYGAQRVFDDSSGWRAGSSLPSPPESHWLEKPPTGLSSQVLVVLLQNLWVLSHMHLSTPSSCPMVMVGVKGMHVSICVDGFL